MNGSGHPTGRCEVRVQPAALRALAERLPAVVVAAVMHFFDGPLAENPLGVGKPLAGPFAGCLGAVRGTYRVIYLVDVDSHTVQVLDIDHRSTLRRRR
ncbi:MAG: type II toxin-antitoxin system RelE family toxin [Pseudonocardiaceae bacterium]